MEDLGKNHNNLIQEEYNIQNLHDIKNQKIKDAERYYEQAMLGTMNITLGIVFIGSLIIKNII
jgi:hypothetical protein